MSKELKSFSIWVAGNNGSHCLRQDHHSLPKTKATPQERSWTWTQTWAQTWNQVIIQEPGDYFLANHLREAEKHLWQAYVWDPVERQSYKLFARKLSVVICFLHTPQNRVCMHFLLICWIAASVSPPDGNSLTSPWVTAKTSHQHGDSTTNQHRKHVWPLRETSLAAKDKNRITSVFNI